MRKNVRTLAVAFSVACLLGASPDKPLRLVKPWSQLDSLSDDQRAQIAEIHRKAREEIRQIEQRERRDILALLSQPQLNALKDLEEKETVARKLKSAASAPPAEHTNESDATAATDASK